MKTIGGPRIERWSDPHVRCATCDHQVRVKDTHLPEELVRDTQCLSCGTAYRYRYVNGRCVEERELEVLELAL